MFNHILDKIGAGAPANILPPELVRYMEKQAAKRKAKEEAAKNADAASNAPYSGTTATDESDEKSETPKKSSESSQHNSESFENKSETFEENSEESLNNSANNQTDNKMNTNLSKTAEHEIWDGMLSLALKIPMVKVDRYTFLRTTLQPYVEADELEAAIACPPAVLSMEQLKEIAKHSINYHRNFVIGLSFAAGLPGGFALLATMSGDMVQYYGHLLCLVQKLSYFYGHADFTDKGRVTDSTRSQLTVMLGVAFGVQAAQQALTQLVQRLSLETAKRMPRLALTKTMYYPIVKQVAKWLGTNLTKNTFGRRVAKMIPFFGGIINGGIALVSFTNVTNQFHKSMRNNAISSAVANNDSDHDAEYVEITKEMMDQTADVLLV